jgi:hypothetical protein
MLIAPQIAIAGKAQQRQSILFRRLRLFDHLGEILKRSPIGRLNFRGRAAHRKNEVRFSMTRQTEFERPLRAAAGEFEAGLAHDVSGGRDHFGTLEF